MAPHADAERGPYPNGYGPLSAMTYLSNKDYLR